VNGKIGLRASVMDEMAAEPRPSCGRGDASTISRAKFEKVKNSIITKERYPTLPRPLRYLSSIFSCDDPSMSDTVTLSEASESADRSDTNGGRRCFPLADLRLTTTATKDG
jgi:hypothetical protein